MTTTPSTRTAHHTPPCSPNLSSSSSSNVAGNNCQTRNVSLFLLVSSLHDLSKGTEVVIEALLQLLLQSDIVAKVKSI